MQTLRLRLQPYLKDKYSNVILYFFIAECPPGTFFVSGICSLCDIGMYQPEENQQTCIACGLGLTTSATGSKEVSGCVGSVSFISTKV